MFVCCQIHRLLFIRQMNIFCYSGETHVLIFHHIYFIHRNIKINQIKSSSASFRFVCSGSENNKMNARNKALAVILAVSAFDSSDDDDDEREPPQKQRRIWRKDWVGRREVEGFYAKLYQELRNEEPTLYHNFLRMTAEQFDHLLSLVMPLISKADTVMRKSISAAERLILTLRFLANGDSFRSLQYLFRIPQPTISKIIPEVLDAIYKVLVSEYIKVCVSIHSFVAWILVYSFLFIAFNFSRRRQIQRLGKPLLANSMSCGNSPTASVLWMGNTW